jgi:hypothetical protein
MTKEVIAQIFKQYHGEEFDIHGLVVSLGGVSLISGRYGFHFKFKKVFVRTRTWCFCLIIKIYTNYRVAKIVY